MSTISSDRGGGAHGPAPFRRQRLLERPAVGDAGQSIDAGERSQSRFRGFHGGQVAQGFDDANDPVVTVADHRGLDGHIETAAIHRQDAPVLGDKGVSTPPQVAYQVVMLGDGLNPIGQQEVGQARPRLRVKTPPMVARAQHFGGFHPGHDLAGLVPGRDFAVRIKDKGRRDVLIDQQIGVDSRSGQSSSLDNSG